jgi:hypothetical protein
VTLAMRRCRRRRSSALGVLIVGLALACAPAAHAAPSWLPSANLTDVARSVTWPATGSDAAGDTVTGWIRYDGSNYVVELATRTAGGAFRVQPLQSGTGFATSLTLATNARGDTIVAWRRDNAASEIWASSRSGLGDFSTPQAIASVPGQTVNEPNAAINDAGAMMVVWWLQSASNTQTVYGAYRAPGGSFNTAPISSADQWNQSPRVALDPSGKATVVWSFWDGSVNIARVRVRAADGTLGTQRNLSATAPTTFPIFATVGLDHAGNAVAVWSQWDGSKYNVTGATRAAASDNWNPLPSFGQSAGSSFGIEPHGNEPQVAVDPNGNALAVWRATDNTITAASRAAGGSFGSPQTGISQPAANTPHVMLDAAGNATAIWARQDADGSRIEASTRPASGSFGPVKTLSGATSARTPAVSVDGLGNALVAWPYDDATVSGDKSRMQYAVYDASAPSVSIDGPAGGTAGQPIGLTANAFDVWGPVATTWAFGDGATANGPSTSHTYGQPGSYGVTVTATDGAGSTASAARSLSVGAAPVPPAPPAPPKRLPIVPAKPSPKWAVKGAKFTLTELTIAKLPKGWKATARCSGKRCPFKTKALKDKKVKSGTLNALEALGKKRTFRAGQTLELRISARGYRTKVVRYVLKKGKKPKPKVVPMR